MKAHSTASNTRWVYEAQSILFAAYGEEYPIDLPPLSEFVSEEEWEAYINHKNALQAGKEIGIFPNPANTHLNVRLPDGMDNAVFELYDLNGKLLRKASVNGSTKVNAIDLPNGIYIHKVSDAKGATFTKGKTVIIH